MSLHGKLRPTRARTFSGRDRPQREPARAIAPVPAGPTSDCEFSSAVADPKHSLLPPQVFPASAAIAVPDVAVLAKVFSTDWVRVKRLGGLDPAAVGCGRAARRARLRRDGLHVFKDRRGGQRPKVGNDWPRSTYCIRTLHRLAHAL